MVFHWQDMLFGRRGAVRNANDRYANLDISYLLQRLERFEGPIILASNLKHKIDCAFLRQLWSVADARRVATIFASRQAWS